MRSFEDAKLAALVKRVGQKVEGPVPKDIQSFADSMVAVVLSGDTVYCVEDPDDYNVAKKILGNSGASELFAVDWSYFVQVA